MVERRTETDGRDASLGTGGTSPGPLDGDTRDDSRIPLSSKAIWGLSAILTAGLFALSWPKYLDHSYWAEKIPLEVLYSIVAYLMAVYVMVVFIRAMQERTLEEA